VDVVVEVVRVELARDRMLLLDVEVDAEVRACDRV
jgi:hypothetical protein